MIKNQSSNWRPLLAAITCLFLLSPMIPRGQDAASTSRIPLKFSGGHDTDPRDHGRPVNLIAGALGVAPEVFREAFSRVHPAPGGTEPDPQEVRRNKAALLNALGKYGITNDQLDRVSNYYRYNGGKGEMWPTKPASAYAVVERGKVTGIVVANGGSGYTSPPIAAIPGFPGVAAKAQLSFDKDFAKNGTVKTITVADGVGK